MRSHDNYLAECFSQPPLTAYRRQLNIRNLLIKSQIPPKPKPYPYRNNRGMTNCGKACTACPYFHYGKEIKINSKSTWQITKKMSCSTFNIIYLLECQKDNCRLRYIGNTGQQLKLCLGDHRGYILNQVTSRATGAHRNLTGHSLADLHVTILEQCRKKSEEYRLEREKNFIKKFDTFNVGIDRE